MVQKIALVAAMTPNRVIGKNGWMPWGHLPSDLKRFHRITVGYPVIMGRRTFDAIYDRLLGPLPNRHNIVLTSIHIPLRDVQIASSPEQALALANAHGSREVFVIGGGQVYERFMPIAHSLHITTVFQDTDGDTYFPEIGSHWRRMHSTCTARWDPKDAHASCYSIYAR